MTYDKNNLKYRYNSEQIFLMKDFFKCINDENNNLKYINEGGQSKIYMIDNLKCPIVVKKINENSMRSFENEVYYYNLTNDLIKKNECGQFLLMYGENKKKSSIYLEHVDGTLLDFFKITNADEILCSMLFQILYGILVIQKKLMTFHCDLHIKNIFYKKINENIKYFRYIIGEDIYLVPNFGYLFIIADFGHAQSLLTSTYNKLNKIDIDFAIKYNYDFNHLKQLYNKILKENLSEIIHDYNDLEKILFKSSMTDENLNNINQIKKKYSSNIKKQQSNILYYCIENDMIDIDKIINKFTYLLPDIKIKKMIDVIFNSKNDIISIIKDNFEKMYEYNNVKKNNVKKNTDVNKTHIQEFIFCNDVNKFKINKLQRMNNANGLIEKIKKMYSVNKFNYNTIKYFYLYPDRNFTPKFLNQMYDDIEPYDYIKPIMKLNERFNNEYYNKIIKMYEFNKKTHLDKYNDDIKIKNRITLDSVDLDEIMLQYIKCRKNCFVITLWPIFSKYADEMIEYLSTYGNIYYTKKINFEENGLINYFISVYDEFSNSDIIKIATDKYSWSRLPNQKSNEITMIIFDNVNNLKLSGQASTFKTTIRNWALNILKKNNINLENIRGNDLIHINDYFYQTIEYCELLLNSNSINLLNNRLYSKIYDKYFETTHLKIETYRKIIYSNLSLESINSLFLIAGVSLFFYGFRPINDLDGICVNLDSNYKKKVDTASEDIKKITELFCDEKTRIFYIEFGATNTEYWKEKWTQFNSLIANYFKISDFNEICWNPNYHYYFKGIKCYLIDFEFYKKLQRSNEIIGTNIWPTLSKDYTDYMMINYLNPKLIKNYIYIDDKTGKLTVSKQIINIYPKLKSLPFNNIVLELIKKFLQSKYKVYLNSDINDDFIKSLFDT